ncbi:hypothetical protein SNEBB_009840, partial [Seison nebaliae]
MENKCDVNLNERRVSLRREGGRITKINKNNRALEHLRSRGRGWVSEDLLKKHDEFINSKFEPVITGNAMNVLLTYLFFDPEDVGNRLKGIIYYQDKDPVLVRGSNPFPLVKRHTEYLIYYPPIQLINFGFFPMELDETYYNLDGTYIEYMDSIQHHLFNHQIMVDIPWIREICINIIDEDGYPKIVVTPENGLSKFGPMQLSYGVHEKLKTKIESVIKYVNENPLTMIDDLRHEFPKLSQEEILLAGYRPNMNPQYWNGNDFKTQRLFRNFLPNRRGNNYKLVGITLAINSEVLWKIKRINLIPPLSAEMIEWNKRTTIDILA